MALYGKISGSRFTTMHDKKKMADIERGEIIQLGFWLVMIVQTT